MTLAVAAALAGAAGCGKTITREATEQLLTADSIDRAIAQLDFSPFADKSVYLDTELLEHKKLDGVGVGGQNYLIGSLRHQLMAAGARLEEKPTEAEFVIEARAGAVGSDSHEVVYGMPANNLLSNVASLTPNAPPMPALPELSLAKQSQEHAATKLRLFAYHRERREIVWQSGEAAANSQASHTWLLGAGPFEKGQIYNGTRFAGDRVSVVPKWLRRKDPEAAEAVAALDSYNETRVFGFEPPPAAPAADGGVRLAAAETPADEKADKADKAEKADTKADDKAGDKDADGKPDGGGAKAEQKAEQDEPAKAPEKPAEEPPPAAPPAAEPPPEAPPAAEAPAPADEDPGPAPRWEPAAD